MSMSAFQNTAPLASHTATVLAPASSSVLYLPFEIWLHLAVFASSYAAVGPAAGAATTRAWSGLAMAVAAAVMPAAVASASAAPAKLRRAASRQPEHSQCGVGRAQGTELRIGCVGRTERHIGVMWPGRGEDQKVSSPVSRPDQRCP